MCSDVRVGKHARCLCFISRCSSRITEVCREAVCLQTAKIIDHVGNEAASISQKLHNHTDQSVTGAVTLVFKKLHLVVNTQCDWLFFSLGAEEF